MTFMVGFGPAVVLGASFVSRHGAVRIGRFDLLCGSLSILALVMWPITGQGNVAIAFSVAADLVRRRAHGAQGLRTTRRSETWLAFACSAVSAAITLLTIQEWSFASAAFPVYILCIGTLLSVLVRFPHLRPTPVRS